MSKGTESEMLVRDEWGPFEVVIAGATIVTMNDARDVVEGWIGIAGGRIAAIGAGEATPAALTASSSAAGASVPHLSKRHLSKPRVIDAAGAIVHPGYVSAHQHSMDATAPVPEHAPPFLEWLLGTYYRTVLSLTPADAAESVRLVGRRMAASGVTTLLDCWSVGDAGSTRARACLAASVEAARESGLRWLFAPMVSDTVPAAWQADAARLGVPLSSLCTDTAQALRFAADAFALIEGAAHVDGGGAGRGDAGASAGDSGAVGAGDSGAGAGDSGVDRCGGVARGGEGAGDGGRGDAAVVEFGGAVLSETGADAPGTAPRDSPLRDAPAGGRVRIWASAELPEMSSDALLDGLAALAASHGTGFTTHLCASPEGAVAADGERAVARLSRLGMLAGTAVGAHLVFADAADRAALATAGTGAAHCPTATMMLGGDRSVLSRLRDAGVHTGLGLDNPSLAGAADMVAELRAALAFDRACGIAESGVSVSDVVAAATIEGARALGMADAIGSIELGKRADLVVVDGSVRRAAIDPVHALVLHSRASDIRLVLVDGEPVFRA